MGAVLLGILKVNRSDIHGGEHSDFQVDHHQTFQPAIEGQQGLIQWIDDPLATSGLAPLVRCFETRMRIVPRLAIEAYCLLKEKVPMGFVEGFNNQIRALQQRAFGYRDEEYFRLKILTCMLPKL